VEVTWKNTTLLVTRNSDYSSESYVDSSSSTTIKETPKVTPKTTSSKATTPKESAEKPSTPANEPKETTEELKKTIVRLEQERDIWKAQVTEFESDVLLAKED